MWKSHFLHVEKQQKKEKLTQKHANRSNMKMKIKENTQQIASYRFFIFFTEQKIKLKHNISRIYEKEQFQCVDERRRKEISRKGGSTFNLFIIILVIKYN